MLTQSLRANAPARQKGVVLLIALIMLVAMTLAGIALVRSVGTTNIIAGNMAFQQSATQSGDAGIETAIAWLTANNNNVTLNSDDATNGYATNGNNPAQNPAAGQSWDAYWTQKLAARARTLSTDAAGNTASFVIDRLCAFAGSPTGGANCSSSPLVSVATGNAEEAGELQINAPSLVYYRITSRIAGPRNTVSYVQAIVAL
jgi:type IV pilus assembly protein PilX